MKLKVLWNLDWHWLVRFYGKKLRQELSYRFAREFYRVEIRGVEVKLGCIDAYHCDTARRMSKNGHHARVAIEEMLKLEGKVVYDIGAYNGVVGILYAKKYPESEVVMFEPSVQNYRQAVSNVHLNGVTNCRVVHGAVGEENGVMKFTQGSNGAEGRSDDGDVVEVFALSELPRADIVKTDAAGAEPSILRGLNYTPKHIVLGVDLELIGRYGDTEASLWKEVTRLGMEKRRLDVANPLDFFLLSRSG